MFPNCPLCHGIYTYLDGENFFCTECSHVWQKMVDEESVSHVVKDAHGQILQDGDSVLMIKDLKIKGSSSVLKVGTKVKNIRLVDSDHPIDCKIEAFGSMKLKAEFVKKI